MEMVMVMEMQIQECDGNMDIDNAYCSPILNQSECEGKKSLIGVPQCNWQE